MAKERYNVAIIGLGFGAEFIPIYQRHPQANMYAICQRNEKKLKDVGDAFDVAKRYTSYEDVLADPSVDFVHVNTPIPEHAVSRSRPSRRASTSCVRCRWPPRSRSASRSSNWSRRPV